MKTIIFTLAMLIVLNGCDSSNFEEHTPDVVVEGYLIAGEPMAEVWVSNSASVQGQYVFSTEAIADATVSIALLSDDSSVENRYAYVMDAGAPGVYKPAAEVITQGGRTYQLEVDVPGQATLITAQTTVPQAFQLTNMGDSTLVYQGETQFLLEMVQQERTGEQAQFVFVTESLTPSMELLTPLYRDLEGDDEETIEDLRRFQSNIASESNFDVNTDGTLTIKYPWFGIVFLGPNRLIVNTLDNNMYDFIRSHEVQQGGFAFSPGEIPDVINKIEGGRGIFGSLARGSVDVVVSGL